MNPSWRLNESVLHFWVGKQVNTMDTWETDAHNSPNWRVLGWHKRLTKKAVDTTDEKKNNETNIQGIHVAEKIHSDP